MGLMKVFTVPCLVALHLYLAYLPILTGNSIHNEPHGPLNSLSLLVLEQNKVSNLEIEFLMLPCSASLQKKDTPSSSVSRSSWQDVVWASSIDHGID